MIQIYEDDSVGDENRLQSILDLVVGFSEAPIHHRHNLVSAIRLFAGTNDEAELEKLCEIMLNEIKSDSK